MTTNDDAKKRDDANQRLADLLQQCASDTAVMLERRSRVSINSVAEPDKDAEDVTVFPCCARELEWLRSTVTLWQKAPRRAADPPPGAAGEPQLWADYAASVLTLIPRARYYVAPPWPPGERDVYPVNAVRAERVPYELRFRNVMSAWFFSAPAPAAARGSAPRRSAHRAKTRPPRRQPK